ncbi:MAG: hypothetical protein JWO41_458 [Candidatus Saccharibacteria bacterium]|nr:hypothetical protein [Candidatus Saccharibacteria bacterium]
MAKTNKSKKSTDKIRKAYEKHFSKAKAFLTKERSLKESFKKVVAATKKKVLLVKEKAYRFLFDHYYGVKLLKPRTTFMGYVLLLAVLYIGLYFVPSSFISSFSYINFTEHALTILIVLLTILLSAGLVLLGDDTRGWSLARMAIIRDVVKLRGLMLSCLLIILISITPNYTYGDAALKVLLSPVLIAAFAFILGIYCRIYLWLSDLAADPSFFDPQDPNAPDDKRDDRSYLGGSYRFARIVHLIRYLNARDAWQAVLEKRIPEGYEELLHEEFFEGVEGILKAKKKDMYGDLSIRLEIYDKYYDRRNLDSWRFYLAYTKRFLLIYSAVSKIVDDRRAMVTNNTEILWRAKHALENTNRRLISDSMNDNRIWALLEAMDAYLEDSDLLMLGNRDRFRSSVVLNYFLNEFFDALFDAKIDTYHFDSYFTEHKHWQVTSDNLYEGKYNVSFVVENVFKEWLFKKLGNVQDQDSLINIDSAIELIFGDADPITIAELYWFLYDAQHTTDSQLIIDTQYKNFRRFGLMGRVSTAEWQDDENVRMQNFAAEQNQQIENAIKLFAARYHQYFRSFWNLDELIQTAQNALDTELEEREKLRLESIIRKLEKIKTIYSENG